MSKEAYKFRNKWAKEEHGYLDWNELAEDNWSGNMAFYENGVMQSYADETNKELIDALKEAKFVHSEYRGSGMKTHIELDDWAIKHERTLKKLM